MKKFVKPNLERTRSNPNKEIQKLKINQYSSDKLSDDINKLFKNYNALNNVHSEFEKFIHIVSTDLQTKIDCLKNVKNNENINWNDKSYASVQLFMLYQYSHRVNRFRDVSLDSLENICNKFSKGEKTDTLVKKHNDILAKLKRRLKHILDVSEKYAVEDIFSNINILKEMSQEMEPPAQNSADSFERTKRYKSLISLQKIIIQDKTDFQGMVYSENNSERSKPDENEKNILKKQKVRTLRSLGDHMTVLTKTYTNRR